MRIVSLVSAATEMLFALGLGEQVVAVSHECDWPPECQRLPRASRSNVDSSASSGQIDQQVRLLLEAGKELYSIDRELLVELRPDLIVTQAQCDVCAVPYADVIKAVQADPQLQQARVIDLNPASLAEMLDDLRRIGTAAGIREHAEDVAGELQRRIDSVRTEASTIPAGQRPRTAIIEWTDPLMLAGNWVPEMVRLAGGQCALTPPREHSRSIEWRELLRFDPEVILVCPCGFDEARAFDELKALSHCAGWKELSAVREDRVFPVDGNAYFNRPGPRLVDSLELLHDCIRTAPAQFATSGTPGYATAPNEGPSPK